MSVGMSVGVGVCARVVHVLYVLEVMRKTLNLEM